MKVPIILTEIVSNEIKTFQEVFQKLQKEHEWEMINIERDTPYETIRTNNGFYIGKVADSENTTQFLSEYGKDFAFTFYAKEKPTHR